MDLSIIIVNYNVKHFLAQCLRSVQRAIVDIQAEIIVVDNNSQDGSQQMVREKFDDVILIDNQDNPGFSKANNQGIDIAKGRYLLLLNPDTVVAEDTFTRCIDFMDQHLDAGALGIKMIDGYGKFLPESKRALPTPWVSFYKIFGLSALFPKSKRFGKYHLTFLDKEENHEIEILSGAFMWMRTSLIREIGGLDETFFMYGEDIDMSYRVILAGMKNYYLSDARIIHYKGESTKTGSLNYVKVFYQAMIIFAKKHFGGTRKRLFIAAIRLAVYFRALLAVLYRVTTRYGFALLEGLMVYAGMYGIKAYWEHYIRFIEGGTYPPEFSQLYMPAYTLLFIALLWTLGAYKRPFRLRPLVLGPFLGFITIATITYMVGPIQNFSRAIVGLSAVFTMIMALATRGLINQRQKGNFFFTEQSHRRILLVGDLKEIQSVLSWLSVSYPHPLQVVGVISTTNNPQDGLDLNLLGRPEEIRQIVRLYQIEEVVYCNAQLPTNQIFDMLEALQGLNVDAKIVPPDTEMLVGPQQILQPFQLATANYRLAQPEQRRHKRWVDVLGAMLLLLTFPILSLAYRQPSRALRGLWQVLRGKKHLVGYSQSAPNLPRLKAGLLNLGHRLGKAYDSNISPALDDFYAREYTWTMDVDALFNGWRSLGEGNVRNKEVES
ncbi:MAG: glycosyltransferase [Bacteroidota bacterium]